jgi:hypothetical protein
MQGVYLEEPGSDQQHRSQFKGFAIGPRARNAWRAVAQHDYERASQKGDVTRCEVHWSYMSANVPVALQSVTLWRHMSLEKFLAVIQTHSLYFSRLSEFRDKYEGLCPIFWQSPVTDVRQLLDLASTAQPGEWQPTAISIPDGKHLKDENLTAEMYVSCWHSGSEESAAMWSLYSGNSGIAIETTADRLGDSLRSCEKDIEIAAVEYMQITPGLLSGRPWTIKRPSFQHEREVRAATRDPTCPNPGILISADIEILIGEIHISPESDPWIEDIVRDVVAKYGLKKQVRRSKLYE